MFAWDPNKPKPTAPKENKDNPYEAVLLALVGIQLGNYVLLHDMLVERENGQQR
jgi:hypothetical protein